MGHESATLRRLGPYTLLEELGSGAMGTVYLAEDEEEERQVALKVLHPHLLERKGFFQRFQREALAGERVRHPNVVRTLDCDIHVAGETGYCLLVMEYVKGRTLRDLLQEWTTVPEALVREIGQQVAKGLAAIHDAGLVHRDLKPENVLLTDDHRVRIMDLGVARHTELSTALTKDGQFAGSLLYAAPEQFRGGSEVGPPTDLYALGVVLYELVSGVNPFRHDEPGAVVNAHLHEIPERLDRRTVDASPFLAEVVATLQAKRADARFESASVLAQTLEEGEDAPWWHGRERALLEEHERRVRVPVRRGTEVYGREDDLALLEQAWRRAKEGDGNTVLLEGEAGIGKSRLVDQFLNDLDDLDDLDGQDAQVLYGSYAPSGGLGAVTDAFVEHFGRADLGDALRPYLTRTPSLVPALAALLRREVPPEGAPSLQGNVLHGVLMQLMQALAAERPLVWVIEDLHFADGDGRKLVLSLARAAAGHGVLLLLTTRPELSEEELAHFGRLGNLTRTGLGRLGARDVVLLLEDAFQSVALAEKLGIRIAKKSDGIPFFVFEMIRGLKEGQFITQLPDGSWVDTKDIDEIEVPSTVRDLIGVRLGDLSKEERAILDVGAVQGFEFDPDLVARVLERPRVSVLQDVADIERRSGVLRAAGRSARFDHHQIQEVLYEALIPALREEYHSLLARALAQREGASAEHLDELPGDAVVFLAEHGLRGREPGDGLPYLDRALDHLAKMYAHETALLLCDTALAVPGLLEGESRLEVLLKKNVRLDALVRRSEQAKVLDEAQALGDAGCRLPLRAELEGAKGTLLYRLDRHEEAKAHAERDLAIRRELGDRKGEGRALRSLAVRFTFLGQNEEARAYMDQALDVAREVGDADDEAAATINVGKVLARLGRPEEARVVLERGRQLALGCGNLRWEAVATRSLGEGLFDLGRYDEARDRLERCLEIARETGDRWAEAGAVDMLGRVCRELGQPEAELEYRRRFLAIAREAEHRHAEGDAEGRLGSVLHALGRYDESLEHHKRSLALAVETGHILSEAYAEGNLGVVSRALRRCEEARVHHERSLTLFLDTQNRGAEVWARGGLGDVLCDLGRYDEARAHLEQMLAVCRELEDRTGEMRAAASLGIVLKDLGRYDEAMEHAQLSNGIAYEVGHPEGEAVNTAILGRLYSAFGRFLDAREHVERVIAINREAGLRQGEALAMLALGDVFDQLDRPEEARECWEQLLTISREIEDRELEAYAHLRGGVVPEAEGDVEAAQAQYAKALALGRELGSKFIVPLAACHLALLPGGDTAGALAAFEEYRDRLGRADEMEARHLLWKATDDRTHLTEAKRLLDHLVEHAPEEYRESMLKNVRLHREIESAWKALHPE